MLGSDIEHALEVYSAGSLLVLSLCSFLLDCADHNPRMQGVGYVLGAAWLSVRYA